MLRAIIIDDEPIGINTLKVLIERLDFDIKIVADSTDPIKGIELIENYKPDIVFLDISMPKMNGFELLENISFKDFKLVFTTAHQEYAIKAIKNKAYDYLLKPIDTNDLEICLKSIIDNQNTLISKSKPKTILELPVNNGIVFIKQQNIVRLEGNGSYANIYLKDKTKYTASKNLKYFEALLDETIFYRCHLSNIINLNEVQKLVSEEGYYALMSDNSLVEITKKNKDDFILRLKDL
ncbi:MAG: LytTR family DNA-binding domain-containing protein [Bacteroidota bacterium]|nr:LytTR family DNA-binding domain-containing protein [Bacteroidota bacterium]